MSRSRQVFKYVIPVNLQDDLEVQAPLIRKVVHCEKADRDNFVIWCEVDQSPGSNYIYMFRTFGTGHQIKSGYVHCGTIIASPFVWHLYGIGPGLTEIP